jgi:4-carboxymuconolactone decarboxylase
VVDQALAVFGSVRGPFSILLHSPELAEKLLPLVPYFRRDSVVEDRLRLIAVLAAVREREADYVWAAQVRLARECGVREEVIALLREQGDPAVLAADEREVVAFARQLMRANRVDQAVFDALRDRHGVRWLVELTAAVNFYALLCGVANVFDVPALEGGDRY